MPVARAWARRDTGSISLRLKCEVERLKNAQTSSEPHVRARASTRSCPDGGYSPNQRLLQRSEPALHWARYQGRRLLCPRGTASKLIPHAIGEEWRAFCERRERRGAVSKQKKLER
jgi:hypothetical protein